MKVARFFFSAELNDFLSSERRNTSFLYQFEGSQSVKHLIEALGIPHPEVHQIIANGQPVDFHYLVQEGDDVQVYPAATSDPSRSTVGSPDPAIIEPRFVIDNHLGRLAAYLRMLGFDVLYRNDYQDEELAQISGQDSRILLTRDRRLLMRNAVIYGYCVRQTNPIRQLVEVLHRFDLYGKITPFRRCLRCNHPLEPVAKEAILKQLQPLTRHYFDEFHICPQCGQIYWKGSHYQRMVQLIEQVIPSNHQNGVEDG